MVRFHTPSARVGGSPLEALASSADRGSLAALAAADTLRPPGTVRINVAEGGRT